MGLKHLKKYVLTPKSALKHRALKLKEQSQRSFNLIKNRISGDYTPKIIPVSFEGKLPRYNLINAAIKEFGYKKYLEIGCFRDECFSQISCDYKVGVDPQSGGTVRLTSDDFFLQNNEKFDFIFIDGLHIYEQVRKDILNALKVLNDGGIIMLHDCLPTRYSYQTVPPEHLIWNGDVWKAFVEARSWADVDGAVCLIDCGIGMLKKRTNSNKLNFPENTDFKNLKYADLADNYKQWLNPVEFDDWKNFANS
ncbi:MAG TPA: class I SAM-dependent methyltransferase [Alphaproteobacteria bacterium]|nr:class I SAM-dependent methyltransferase [Alphaproteobacteria bacterium]